MKPPLLAACLLGAALAHASAAFAARPLSFPVAPIQWAACGADTFADSEADVAKVKKALGQRLGDRLQCARMHVPLDHYHPEGPRMTVGLIRARALDTPKREGAYFFHIGGPGGNPGDFIIAAASKWSLADSTHAVTGWQRKVAERFDLVAVIPRGLEGGDSFQCRGIDSIESPPDALSDWAATSEAARDIAENCAANPAARWIGTEQHVFDLEQARLAMGESKLHFVGYSYGGMAGAWYRAMFPATAGRMLLDSSIDFTASIDDADLATLGERQREFQRRALRPLLAKPALYGVTGDEADVLRDIHAMPARARNAWLPLVQSAASLKATLVLGSWLAEQNWMTESEMHARLANTRFSADAPTEARVRRRAEALIGTYFGNDADVIEALDAAEPDAEVVHGNAWYNRRLGTRESVFLATRCNDNPWEGTDTHWRNVMRERSATFPAARQGVEFFSLVCTRWSARTSQRPSLEPIHHTSPFLLIHAEHDVRTPLDGAARILDRYPGARLVVAKGVSGHAILATSHTPCVESAAGHYLLTGQVPEARLSSCAYVKRPRRARHEDHHPRVPTDADELMERALQSG
ncbi:alpha/beta hydrolase [Luteibacter aegosomaticola]|uniref:alpha/beta fold hydrolase n=1 Tax=Luteibacter aegosomaticola TaxID=2911538 RepID=UPI001FF88A95|nr:alpha/beta fold hydrolase [Luteibacter aegosomaticola]UPG90315.1 alpha/beta hydrolase [Luteibacter aegosomaticola]